MVCTQHWKTRIEIVLVISCKETSTWYFNCWVFLLFYATAFVGLHDTCSTWTPLVNFSLWEPLRKIHLNLITQGTLPCFISSPRTAISSTLPGKKCFPCFFLANFTMSSIQERNLRKISLKNGLLLRSSCDRPQSLAARHDVSTQ